VINVFATFVLLMYMETLGHVGALASDQNVDLGEVRSVSPLLHAVLALVLLVVATALAVYKPRGVTRFGRRSERERVPAIS
jgi:hypothetical protein